jgi:protein OS-9
MRQFREAQQTAPSPPEGYTPKEDPTYPGYTLGHAHPPKRKGRKGTDVAATEQTATFGTGPASRYLVQTWTDGTRCDKSGQPREVKVEVHCSMTAGDHIYMVKEIDTCKYVVVIHSPHLCSLPGFRPQTADDIVPVPIRCREIVTDDEFERWEAEPKPDPAEQLRIAADRAAEEAAEAVVGKEDPAEPPAFKHKEGDSKVDGDLIKRLEEILQNAFADQLIDVSMLDLEQSEEDVVDSFVIETAEGEDRRAMLERLQRAIQEELAGGEARVVVRDEL